MEIDFDYILELQKSLLGKEARLRTFKMTIKNMKRYLRKDEKNLLIQEEFVKIYLY